MLRRKKRFQPGIPAGRIAYTASCIGGIFNIYHSLTIIATLCGIYSLYLLYTGLEPMTEVTPEKKASYFIVSMLCMIAVYFVVGLILAGDIPARIPGIRILTNAEQRRMARVNGMPNALAPTVHPHLQKRNTTIQPDLCRDRGPVVL